MKSCLKGSSSIPSSPGPKCVAFPIDAESFAEIHWADEWDRSPSEPARDLSFQELQELHEIQESLPHAPQPGAHILSTVAVKLLPLVAPPHSPSPSQSTSQSQPQSPARHRPPLVFVMPPGRARASAASPPTRLASPALTHLRPPPPRPKPALAFLPLLPSSPSAAPGATSMGANASAPASTTGAQVHPPARPAAGDTSYFPAHPHRYDAAAPFGSSAYDYKQDRAGLLGSASERQEVPAGADARLAEGNGEKRRMTKKSFMVINDEVVEIEEDDGEEDADEEAPPACALALATVRKIEAISAVETEHSSPTRPPSTPVSPTTPTTRIRKPPPPPISVSRPSPPQSPTTRKTGPTTAHAAGRRSPVQPRARVGARRAIARGVVSVGRGTALSVGRRAGGRAPRAMGTSGTSAVVERPRPRPRQCREDERPDPSPAGGDSESILGARKQATIYVLDVACEYYEDFVNEYTLLLKLEQSRTVASAAGVTMRF
ncbi:hypothetical protein B0H17DRAFT_1174279 [Mycena rosella]|uniref:Uncharacterized protein n=1 Tax=Mycena rosella TaxID=1033263 RepID=A0AAD7H0D4_MYCRO|nr:hypothetical protein B0H17DRAFT_1174279 [Mycena rosella]